MWQRFAAPLASVASFHIVLCDDKHTVFWKDKWKSFGTQTPSWHKAETNSALLKHAERFGVTRESKVLVPLCGKSLDLLYLRNISKEVIGVECVKRALDDLSRENKLEWTVDGVPQFEPARAFDGPRPGRYFGQGPNGLGYYLDLVPATKTHTFVNENLTVLCGDFFEVVLPRVDRVFDRAALVAIMPADRKKYVKQIDDALSPGGKILLVTLACSFERVQGPPFPVPESEVRELFPEVKWNVELLSTELTHNHPSPLAKTDQVTMDQLQFLITKKKDEQSSSSSRTLQQYVAVGGFAAIAGAIALAISKLGSH
eukprot:GEMP01029482.1.p1 GENE.GEMP01029482.1~~GEMP01029482.1.p1  ORF type:complete len:353 (+),score=59.94 GEMP01029482.1:119-1060(+)